MSHAPTSVTLAQISEAVGSAIHSTDVGDGLPTTWQFDTVDWHRPGTIVLEGYTDGDQDEGVFVELAVQRVYDSFERSLVVLEKPMIEEEPDEEDRVRRLGVLRDLEHAIRRHPSVSVTFDALGLARNVEQMLRERGAEADE